MATKLTDRRPLILAVAIVIIVASVGWTVYKFLPQGTERGTTVNPPQEPVVVEAKTLTDELRKDPRFMHLEVHQVQPGVWACTGEIAKRADIPDAQKRAKELKPDVEWQFEIEGGNR